MLSLDKRKERREHDAKVYAGEIDDPKVTSGTDASGNVLGDDGKPVAGSNGISADDDDADKPKKTDFSRMTNAQLDKLVEGNKPEGWDAFDLDAKRKWLTDDEAAKSTGSHNSGGGWNQ